jgi:glycerol-3-phosphate acyltransferase PlsY
MPVSAIIVTTLVSYFLGNHNGAICVSAMLHDDVREHGSGNAGLTNFIRNYGASRSVLVILIDVFKAVLACWMGAVAFAPYGYPLEGKVLAGVAVMVGHDFPALLGFRGGKGILSGWFIAWMIDWRVGALIGIVFFAVYFATQLVSLCSVLAAITFGIGFAVLYWGNPFVVVGGVFMGGLTVFQHRANIVRLLRKKESKTNLFQLGKK